MEQRSSSFLSRIVAGGTTLGAMRLWDVYDCVDLSVAFAYHTLQSFFPLLLIVLAIASSALGQDVVDRVDEVLNILGSVLPHSVIGLVESTLRDLIRQGTGAGLFGLFLLLISATNAYPSLQRGAERLWSSAYHARTSPAPVRRHIRDFLAARLEAFAVVAALGGLVVGDSGVGQPERVQWCELVGQRHGQPTMVSRPRSSRIRSSQPEQRTGIFAVGAPADAASPVATGSLASSASRRTVLWVSHSPFSTAPWHEACFLWGRVFRPIGVVGGVLILILWVWTLGLAVHFGQCLSVSLVLTGSSLHPARTDSARMLDLIACHRPPYNPAPE